MSDIADKKTDALIDKLNDDDTVSEGYDPDHTDPDCWKDDVIEAAFREAVRMVTKASMKYDEKYGEQNGEPHPMDVVDVENVKSVYATSTEWRAPVFILELDEMPAYIPETISETREVYARRKPGLSSEATYVRIQIREGL